MNKTFLSGFICGFILSVALVFATAHMIKVEMDKGFKATAKAVFSDLPKARAQVQNRYFAVSASGQIIELDAEPRATISHSNLTNWVSEAITQAMTFGFHDYQRRHQKASLRFTDRAWKQYMDWLEPTHLAEVERLQMVMTSTTSGAPITLEQEKYGTNVFKIPVTYTLRSGKNRKNYKASIIVKTETGEITKNNSLGLYISDWSINTEKSSQ